MNYSNVYQSPDGTFFVLVCTRAGRYIDKGYATAEEAAWQADRAKHVLNNHGLIGRLSAYNFPDRLKTESESAWSVLPRPLVDFYCASINSDTPVTEADAIRVEEAKQIAEANAERQRLIDEAAKKLNDEKNKQTCIKLQLMVSTLRQLRDEFEALNLPKDTKERNSIQLTLGLLGQRLAQLS